MNSKQEFVARELAKAPNQGRLPYDRGWTLVPLLGKQPAFLDVERAQNVVDNMPGCPPIFDYDFEEVEDDDTPVYMFVPGLHDYEGCVVMPPREYYVNDGMYFHYLFHELVHSTGNKERVGRSFYDKDRSPRSGYRAEEELVAEIGAAFLCFEIGMRDVPQYSRAYIQSWSKDLKAPSQAIIRAAEQASKAVAYILGRTTNRTIHPMAA